MKSAGKVINARPRFMIKKLGAHVDRANREPSKPVLIGEVLSKADMPLSEFAREVTGTPLAAHLVSFADVLSKAGPFIGPRGGKWQDPGHKIPYREEGPPRRAGGAGTEEHRKRRLADKIKRREPGKGEPVSLDSWELRQVLSTGKFALVSAGPNPKVPGDKSMTDQQVRARHDKLRERLVSAGCMFTPTVGHYEGREDSFLVMAHEAERAEVIAWGREFNQDSVIYSERGKNQMVYTHGEKSDKNLHVAGKGWEPKPGATDYFTVVKHPSGGSTKFSLNFDWADEKELAKAQRFFIKAGPYIGPRGGKWADPKHTIPWKETKKPSVSNDEKNRLKEFYLDEIDAWRSGAKATPGQPVESENYARVMREEVKRLEKELDKLSVKKAESHLFIKAAGHKYTRRWKDKKGKWRYEYGKPKLTYGKASQEALEEPRDNVHYAGPISEDMDLSRAESAIAGESIEHCAIFGSNGQQMWRQHGTTAFIKINPEHAKWWKAHGNVTFTHNHPSGNCFSDDDLNYAVRNNFKEMRAVGRYGDAFILTRPKGGWGISKEDLSERKKGPFTLPPKFAEDLATANHQATENARRNMDDYLRERGGRLGDENDPNFSQERWAGYVTEQRIKLLEYYFGNKGWRIRRERLTGFGVAKKSASATEHGGHFIKADDLGPRQRSEVRGVGAGVITIDDLAMIKAGMVPVGGEPLLLSGSHLVIESDTLSKAAKPGGRGWQAIPKGKRGGYRRAKGKGYEYWYPERAVRREPPRKRIVPSPEVPYPKLEPKKGRRYSEADFRTGQFDKDPAHWRYVRPDPSKPYHEAWVVGGIDPQSLYPVKIAGRPNIIYQIVTPDVGKGWAELRNVNPPATPLPGQSDIIQVSHDRIYPVEHYVPRPAEERPPWALPVEKVPRKVLKERERIGGAKKIPRYGGSTAEKGTALKKIEGGQYRETVARYYQLDADEIPHKEYRRTLVMPDDERMKLIKEFAPMIKKIARKNSKRFALRQKQEIWDELQAATTEGFLTAIDSYPGGTSFILHAKFLSDQYARMHAAREFAGGIAMPRRHARMLMSFIAARAEAARVSETDKPDLEQVANFWKLKKRDVHEGLRHNRDQPLPMRNYTIRAGNIVTGKDNPGKLEWAEHFAKFLDGQAAAQGSDYLETNLQTQQGLGVGGVGMSDHDRVIVRHDLERALDKLTDYQVTVGKMSYRTDASEIIKRTMGLEGPAKSLQAVALEVPVERSVTSVDKKGNPVTKYVKLKHRAAQAAMARVFEDALEILRGELYHDYAKGLVERAAARVIEPAKIPHGPTWSQILQGRAKALSRKDVRQWREKTRASLRRSIALAKTEGDAEKAARLQRSLQRVSGIGMRKARIMAAEHAIRTAPANARWFRSAEAIAISLPEKGRHMPVEIYRTDPDTGEIEKVVVGSYDKFRDGIRKAENGETLPDMAALSFAAHFPRLTRVLFGSEDMLATIPTLEREVLLELVGIL